MLSIDEIIEVEEHLADTARIQPPPVILVATSSSQETDDEEDRAEGKDGVRELQRVALRNLLGWKKQAIFVVVVIHLVQALFWIGTSYQWHNPKATLWGLAAFLFALAIWLLLIIPIWVQKRTKRILEIASLLEKDGDPDAT